MTYQENALLTALQLKDGRISGATLHPHSLEAVTVKRGYAVSLRVNSISINMEHATISIIEKVLIGFTKNIMDYNDFRETAHKVGLWVDDKDILHIEHTRVIRTLEEAYQVAIDEHQSHIYFFETGDAVSVNEVRMFLTEASAMIGEVKSWTR